jgi:hypothetical protein
MGHPLHRTKANESAERHPFVPAAVLVHRLPFGALTVESIAVGENLYQFVASKDTK